MLKLKRPILTDMTEGRPAPLLLRFMIPMLIGNIFQQLYSMADTMIVGKTLGSDALAAVGATGSLNFLFFSLCNGLASGLGILVSQAFGAGQRKKADRKLRLHHAKLGRGHGQFGLCPVKARASAFGHARKHHRPLHHLHAGQLRRPGRRIHV